MKRGCSGRIRYKDAAFAQGRAGDHVGLPGWDSEMFLNFCIACRAFSSQFEEDSHPEGSA
jgi:hypothetical protein